MAYILILYSNAFAAQSLTAFTVLHLTLLAKPRLNLLNMHNKHAGRKLWGTKEAKGQICNPNVQNGETCYYKLKTRVGGIVLLSALFT